jgi:hypothetical protein
MSAGPATVVALAALAALATSGCGLGAGSDVGGVHLSVTRHYGRDAVLEETVGDVRESDTVIRVLDRSASITTRYGGGFVQSINGTEGGSSGGRYRDWFFYVNGVESPTGAADVALSGGERIWWDYRDWTAAMHVPAVVGSWPQPLRGGYGGERHPVKVECDGGGDACAEVRARVEAAMGAKPRAKTGGDTIRVLVGPWSRLRSDPAASQIERGPQYSGVFAKFRRRGSGYVLEGLATDGRPARKFGSGAGLVAATRRYDSPPVWVVTGAADAGVSAAAKILDEADLRNRYAVATEGGAEAPLPLR